MGSDDGDSEERSGCWLNQVCSGDNELVLSQCVCAGADGCSGHDAVGSVVFATTFSTPFAVAALTPLVRAISLASASAAALLLRGGVGVAGRRVSAVDRRLLLQLLIEQVHAGLLRLLRRGMATTFAHEIGPLLAIDGLKHALLRCLAAFELGGEGVKTGAMQERRSLL